MTLTSNSLHFKMSLRAADVLNKPLPDEMGLGRVDEKPVEFVKHILRKSLPEEDHQKLDEGVSWTLNLDKHKSRRKVEQPRKKKKFLTRKERIQLGLLKLPKSKWNYDHLQKLRDMWKDYMLENLDMIKRAPKCNDPEWNLFSSILMKSEFIGAEIVVVRSKTPSLIDVGGTIVLETKATFQIVTKESKLKIILKEHSVFNIILNGLKFIIFGKHLLTRPSERSVKKIKLHMLPDLH